MKRLFILPLLVLLACSSQVDPASTRADAHEGSVDYDNDPVIPNENFTHTIGERIYAQSFEADGDDWHDDFSDAYDFTRVARVSNRAHEGDWSIRGNLQHNFEDPITGLTGKTGYFEWQPNELQGLHEVFVRYWFRLDTSTWNGYYNGDSLEGLDPSEYEAECQYPNYDADNPARVLTDHVAGKLLYLSDNDVETHAYFMGMTAESIVNNGAYSDYYHNTLPYPWGENPYEPEGQGRLTALDPEWSIRPDGTWHKWEMYLNYDQDYGRVWVDGHSFLDDATDETQEGIIRLSPEFYLRGLRFWYAWDCFFINSLDGPEGEYVGGWQVDDLEIFDGLPEELALTE